MSNNVFFLSKTCRLISVNLAILYENPTLLTAVWDHRIPFLPAAQPRVWKFFVYVWSDFLDIKLEYDGFEKLLFETLLVNALASRRLACQPSIVIPFLAAQGVHLRRPYTTWNGLVSRGQLRWWSSRSPNQFIWVRWQDGIRQFWNSVLIRVCCGGTLFLFPFLLPSSLAMFNIPVTIVLLLSCFLGAIAVPLERRAGGVITQCTRPNTAALTFVRRSCLPHVQLILPPPSPLCMRLTSIFFPPFSGWRPIQLSVRNLHDIHNRGTLIPYFREDIVNTLKAANAKGTFFFSS